MQCLPYPESLYKVLVCTGRPVQRRSMLIWDPGSLSCMSQPRPCTHPPWQWHSISSHRRRQRDEWKDKVLLRKAVTLPIKLTRRKLSVIDLKKRASSESSKLSRWCNPSFPELSLIDTRLATELFHKGMAFSLHSLLFYQLDSYDANTRKKTHRSSCWYQLRGV